jgi:hypothetical protein
MDGNRKQFTGVSHVVVVRSVGMHGVVFTWRAEALSVFSEVLSVCRLELVLIAIIRS